MITWILLFGQGEVLPVFPDEYFDFYFLQNPEKKKKTTQKKHVPAKFSTVEKLHRIYLNYLSKFTNSFFFLMYKYEIGILE